MCWVLPELSGNLLLLCENYLRCSAPQPQLLRTRVRSCSVSPSHNHKVITIIMFFLSSYGAKWELKPFFLHTHEEWGKGELWGLLFFLTRWSLQIEKRSEMVRDKMQSEVPTYPWQWLRANQSSRTGPHCCSEELLNNLILTSAPSPVPYKWLVPIWDLWTN